MSSRPPSRSAYLLQTGHEIVELLACGVGKLYYVNACQRQRAVPGTRDGEIHTLRLLGKIDAMSSSNSMVGGFVYHDE